ncbi:hypothetical protein, partial [Acinetobacter baumannii]|uniref:hypothetical protein n=1 Tax=Acinetobacter baumannii TaxID=470 RepID=UPI001C07BC1B
VLSYARFDDVLHKNRRADVHVPVHVLLRNLSIMSAPTWKTYKDFSTRGFTNIKTRQHVLVG